jgi:Domain of unknown function (DUF4347)/FG-GAP-like repeat
MLNDLLTAPDSRSIDITPFQTLVVFDERVSDIELLSQALLPGSIGFTISSTDDGLGTISHLLATTGAKYLAIVAHGEPGVVHLGKTPLNIQQLQLHPQLLEQWGVKEIALYSCEVAQGAVGKDLIYQLSELTGATVAAAANKTGSVALGGSWDLAITTGEILAPMLFESSILQTYQAVLAVSFGAATNYPLGINPYSTRTADLNGDGFDDIFSGNSTTVGAPISVLLSNGTGGFLPATTYSAGYDPFSVVALDVNGDGKLDLVAVNGGINNTAIGPTVSVLLNNGNGTFGTATAVGLGIPQVIFTSGASNTIRASVNYLSNTPRVGDFNNDGIDDLLVVGRGENNIFDPLTPGFPGTTSKVSVLLSGVNGANGIGFSGPIVSPATDSATSATLGDFNNDGKLDVVTLSLNSPNVSLMLGNGNGSFGPPGIFANSFLLTTSGKQLRTGDFNGDGNFDIVVADGDNSISVMLGNGAGSLGAPTRFVTGNNSDNLVVGDIDDDGKLDVITISVGSNTISVLTGNGTGGFSTPTIFAVGSTPQQVSIGDFNGDGEQDLVTGNQSSSNVSVLLNTTITATTRNDFNGDRKSDILWRNDNGAISLWQMNGSTVTSNKIVTSLSSDWKAAGVGDFNADRKSDILWRNDNGAVALWQMNGSTVISNKIVASLTSDWKISGTGDFNGDRKSDIVWRNDNGAIAMWQMNGSTVTSNKIVASLSSDWKSAGIGDFNGDGKSDMLWRNDNGAIALWQMDGSNVVSSKIVASLSSDWKAAGVGDFNGDGKSDMLWRNDNGAVAMWQMDGSTVIANNIVASLSSDWKSAGIGDFNGDGKSDISWRNDNGANSLWQMNGSTVTNNSLISSLDSSWKVAAPII